MVKRYPELTHKLRAVKEYSIDHMDDLLEQATKSLEANGVKVYVAQTEEDARDYIAKIVGKNLVVIYGSIQDNVLPFSASPDE